MLSMLGSATGLDRLSAELQQGAEDKADGSVEESKDDDQVRLEERIRGRVWDEALESVGALNMVKWHP